VCKILINMPSEYVPAVGKSFHSFCGKREGGPAVMIHHGKGHKASEIHAVTIHHGFHVKLCIVVKGSSIKKFENA
jgi:hypothetical protein